MKIDIIKLAEIIGVVIGGYKMYDKLIDPEEGVVNNDE